MHLIIDQSGENMKSFAIEDCFIRPGGKIAANVVNPATVNPKIGLKNLAFIYQSSAFEEIC
jgi:hypothetical protein